MCKKYALLRGTLLIMAGVLIFFGTWSAHGDERTAMTGLSEKPAGGEGAGGTVLIPSLSICGPGDLSMESGSGWQKGRNPAPAGVTYGSDVKVRPTNLDTAEFHHAMASDSNGNLYVAWQDNGLTHEYIQVYKSTDGGNSWIPYGYVFNSSYDLIQPSIAAARGTNGDTLLLAYIVDDTSFIPYPEMATSPLDGYDWSIHSVPIWDWWEGYAKPVIISDSWDYSSWYAYLTCEGIYEYAIDNVNVCTWRSTDGGVTWSDEWIPFGEFDEYAWIDPDISYGTTQNRVFLVTYNADDYTIYTMSSDNYAYSWNPMVPFYTHSPLPHHPVDPEIAAATNNDNVMVCCTRFHNLDDDIGQGYSQDAGETWSTCWVLTGCSDHDEYAAALTANEGGGQRPDAQRPLQPEAPGPERLLAADSGHGG
ncbi:MAG: hypothetical protein ACYTG7_09120 [Planctomycetota bacterium]|jgi:hypothetical protein